MAVPFSNTKLRVPHGFQNLLEGFAREVLRCQPPDIYQFGAMYFDELIKHREETGEEDLAKLGAKLEDRFYNNTAFQVSERACDQRPSTHRWLSCCGRKHPRTDSR